MEEQVFLVQGINNKQKMVSDQIHHLDEVTRMATAVGQRKEGPWTKVGDCKRQSCQMW